MSLKSQTTTSAIRTPGALSRTGMDYGEAAVCVELGSEVHRLELRVGNPGLLRAWTDESLRQQVGATAEMVRAGVLGGSDDELVDRVGAYADAGADQVNISLRAPFDVDAIERFSAAAGLPAA